RFRLAKIDLLDCFHRVDHVQLLALFKQVCSQSEKFMFPPPNTNYLLREIDWFLKEAVVLLGGQSYRFIRGLPQGSCISPGLVNLYLAHADRSLSKKLSLWAPEKTKAASTTTAVLRYLDDYLCIAPSDAALREVMRELQSNLEAHGLTLNPQKVQSNLVNFAVTICRLNFLHRQGGYCLLRSTVAAFLHRLRAHRGELHRLFKAVRRNLRLQLIKMELRTKSLS
ncbi:uncharacterized protein DEA37_0009932, partial [Paragonimus westermani]